MTVIVLFFCMTLLPFSSSIIITQYAKNVIDHSSQYSTTNKSANQVIGEPDVYPHYGDNNKAWTTQYPDTGLGLGGEMNLDWISVEINEPVYILSIIIYETFNPGAVSGLSVWDYKDSEWITIWLNPSMGPIEGTTTESRAFVPFYNLFPSPYLSDSYRLELDTSVVSGYNEIDALAIIGILSYCPMLFSPPAICDHDNDIGSICSFQCPVGYYWNSSSILPKGTIVRCNELGVWNLTAIENITLIDLCLPTASCTTFQEIDFLGETYQSIQNMEVESCCSHCDTSSQCLIWSYNLSNKECQLKNKRSSSSPLENSQIKSGIVTSRICSTCTPGSYCNTSLSPFCFPCEAGTYGLGGICLPCQDPHSTSLPGTSSCFCINGYAGDGISCSPCPEGTYGLNGVCSPCLDPNAESVLGSTSCRCKDGYYGNGFICLPCPNNTFSVRNNNNSTCTSCRTCESGSYVSLLCNRSMDTKCKACQTCGTKMFRKKNCSLEENTVCQACSKCSEKQKEIQHCSEWEDTLCMDQKMETKNEGYQNGLSIGIIVGLSMGGFIFFIFLVIIYYWRKSISEWVLTKVSASKFSRLLKQNDVELEKGSQGTLIHQEIESETLETEAQVSDSQSNEIELSETTGSLQDNRIGIITTLLKSDTNETEPAL